MSLESFGEQLRKGREAKQISLPEISEATRISVKFLQAIEAGKFSILPQAYIRAFIREYARAIDFDPEKAIQEYDEANQEIHAAAEEWISRSRNPAMRQTQERTKEAASLPIFSQRSVTVFAVVVVVAVVVVYVLNTGPDASRQKPVSEIAFDQVVRESEAAAVKTQRAPSSVSPTLPAAIDSLRLELTTTDSVWLAITIDNTRKGEYLFPPQRKRTWAGKEQFLVSLGNAGAATFKLNGVELGVLGKRGAVARNVLITQSGVHRAEQ